MTEPRLIGIDIDLRRIHAWDEKLGRVCYKAKDFAQLQAHLLGNVRGPATLLVEVASAVDYTDAGAAALRYNKRRWMLWNIAMAAQLDALVTAGPRGITMLVAPSNVWTNGYTEEQRQELACVAPSNHDLRECQAMIWFYRQKPSQWTSLTALLNRL